MLALIAVLAPIHSYAATAPGVVWEHIYTAPGDSGANCIANTSDGGFIVTGYTHQMGDNNSSMFLMKTDSLGNMTWDKIFGGGLYDASGFSVVQAPDGGYTAVGYIDQPKTQQDVYLVKTDANGNQLWNKTYGGPQNDVGYWVANTPDGGYIITGYTYSFIGNMQVYLIKTDANGNMEWNQTFGGGVKDCGNSVEPTQDGGYIIAGYTRTYGHQTTQFMDTGGEDVWLIKTNSNGTEQWNRTYGGSDFDAAYAVIQSSDGGYMLAGDTYSYGLGNNNGSVSSNSDQVLVGGNSTNSNANVWLIKTDSNGSEQWNETFGGINDDGAFSVIETPDGGYVTTGVTHSYGSGNSSIYTIKVNSTGGEEWTSVLGGSYDNGGQSIVATGDGGYVIAGYTQQSNNGYDEVLLFKLGNSTATVTKNSPDSSIYVIGIFLGVIVIGFLAWFVFLRKK